MRKILLLVVLVLTTSACGGGDNSQAADQPSAAADASQEAEGPTPLDFELALADGSSFKLSDEAKPVYLVFWAEW